LLPEWDDHGDDHSRQRPELRLVTRSDMAHSELLLCERVEGDDVRAFGTTWSLNVHPAEEVCGSGA